MDIKKILVPIGGSAYSRNALSYAILLSKKFHSEILGIYVEDTRLFRPYFRISGKILKSAIRAKAEKIKSYFTERCRKEGVSARFRIRIGLVSNIVLNEAKNVDLVIIGKRGEHASWLRRHLGSACTRIIHSINKPVLIVSNRKPGAMGTLLLCYAGGDCAAKSLKVAGKFVKGAGFNPVVLTVSTKKTRAIAVQRRAKEYFDGNAIKARYLLTIGNVEKEITKIAGMEKIDMLIVGVGRQKSYGDLLSLCLADKVLFDSDIPVLFVR